jgi:ribosomal protein S18 acetylase RimI-like enzyme
MEFMLNKSEPIFAVDDVPATIQFYREVLGFQTDWLWGDPPTFGGVGWGPIQILFGKHPELRCKIEGHQHMFRVDDVRGLYEKHKAAGAPIVSDIGNKPWGQCEYTVRDINGYHLRFVGPSVYERPKTATDLLPPHIRIEKRTPTVDDFTRLMESVGWSCDRSIVPRALQYAIFCIVATDTRNSQVVGVLRVCGDGRHYDIWDVAVQPDYQGQKIGTTMVEMAMKELRQLGPAGAFVGLFTPKESFYRRLGFISGGGMHQPL